MKRKLKYALTLVLAIGLFAWLWRWFPDYPVAHTSYCTAAIG